MIKEFRIGNWVDVNGKIEQIWKIEVAAINGIITPRILVIPLTPEILEMCGFNRWRSGTCWDHWRLANGWHIEQWKTDETVAGWEEKGVCYWGDSYIKVQYLHQLQNLYFALTNEELDVKLSVATKMPNDKNPD